MGMERTVSCQSPARALCPDEKSQGDGVGTSIRFTTATTPSVLPARLPAHACRLSVAASPVRKTTPSCTRTFGAVNQPVASSTRWSRARISSSRAAGFTATSACAVNRVSRATCEACVCAAAGPTKPKSSARVNAASPCRKTPDRNASEVGRTGRIIVLGERCKRNERRATRAGTDRARIHWYGRARTSPREALGVLEGSPTNHGMPRRR